MEGVGKMSIFNLDSIFGDIGELLLESAEDYLYSDILPVTPLSDDENRGELRRSLKVKKINNREVIIYCDEKIAHYAKYVHEMPPETNWTTQGTNNKFIERPLLTTGNKIYLNLANKVSKKGALTRSKFKVYKLGETNTSFFNTKTGNITKI